MAAAQARQNRRQTPGSSPRVRPRPKAAVESHPLALLQRSSGNRVVAGLLQRQLSSEQAESEAEKAETASSAGESTLFSFTPGDPPDVQRSCACGGICEKCAARDDLLQPKLTVNAPNDLFELEADRMADAALRQSAAPAGEAGPAPVTSIQRQTEDEEAEREGDTLLKLVQRHAADEALHPDSRTAGRIESLRGQGTPLPPALRADFERRFGRDFSAVRIHTGSLAHDTAVALNARAYVFANHVVFRGGAFAPALPEGRRLLAHELTHVAQQGHAPALRSAGPRLASSSPARVQRELDPFSTTADPSQLSDEEIEEALNRIAEEAARLGYPTAKTPDMKRVAALYVKFARSAPVYTPGMHEYDLWNGSINTKGLTDDAIENEQRITRRMLLEIGYPDTVLDVKALLANYRALEQAKNADQFTESEFDVSLDEDVADFEGKPGMVQDPDGANLRVVPTTRDNDPIELLPFNTTFIINFESGGFYHVTLENGKSGFVAKHLVIHELPEPDARLHLIKPGQYALKIVKQYYKGDAIEWGQDERFYVNVLVWLNEQSQRPGPDPKKRPGIYKPPDTDDWADTKTTAGEVIWIASVEFAKGLEGTVKSGSFTYGVWQTVRDLFVGQTAFIVGLLEGAAKSIADVFIGLYDLIGLAWKVIKSIFTGSIISDIRHLIDDLSKLSLSSIIDAVKDWFWEHWNTKSTWDRWKFIGQVVGYAAMEILMLIFSDGILTAVKWVGKSAKIAELISKFPTIEKFAKAAKAARLAAGSKAEELAKAVKGMRVVEALTEAHEWARKILRIPITILADMTEAAAERLKGLAGWAKARLRHLVPEVMRKVLGCASPCEVDVHAIEEYLRNLAPKAVAGAKRLTKVEDILAALPKGMVQKTIRKKLLTRPALMKAVEEAGLTDLDFAKLGDFLTAADKANGAMAYRTFCRYVTAVVPAKTGGDIDELNRIAKLLIKADPRQGAALKGPMFEQFGRVYVKELGGKNFLRLTFRKADYKFLKKSQRTVDNFVTGEGEIWELKHSFSKVPDDQASDYSRLIGRTAPDGVTEVKSVNYMFPTKEAAEANTELITKYGFNVYYVQPGGSTLVPVVP